jgi:hypothetical protein
MLSSLAGARIHPQSVGLYVQQVSKKKRREREYMLISQLLPMRVAGEQ